MHVFLYFVNLGFRFFYSFFPFFSLAFGFHLTLVGTCEKNDTSKLFMLSKTKKYASKEQNLLLLPYPTKISLKCQRINVTI